MIGSRLTSTNVSPRPGCRSLRQAKRHNHVSTDNDLQTGRQMVERRAHGPGKIARRGRQNCQRFRTVLAVRDQNGADHVVPLPKWWLSVARLTSAAAASSRHDARLAPHWPRRSRIRSTISRLRDAVSAFRVPFVRAMCLGPQFRAIIFAGSSDPRN